MFSLRSLILSTSVPWKCLWGRNPWVQISQKINLSPVVGEEWKSSSCIGCVWGLVLITKEESFYQSPQFLTPCLTPPAMVTGASQSQTIPDVCWERPDQFVHFSTLFPSASSYNSVSFHSSLQGGTQSCINVFFSLLKSIAFCFLNTKANVRAGTVSPGCFSFPISQCIVTAQ